MKIRKQDGPEGAGGVPAERDRSEAMRFSADSPKRSRQPYTKIQKGNSIQRKTLAGALAEYENDTMVQKGREYGRKTKRQNISAETKENDYHNGVVVLVIFIGYTILGSLLSAVYAKDSTPEGDGEMRGVWVSTVYSLDYPEAVTADEEALRQQADEILDDSKAMGMNAVFLQVRPSADALYDRNIIRGAGILPEHREKRRKTVLTLWNTGWKPRMREAWSSTPGSTPIG